MEIGDLAVLLDPYDLRRRTTAAAIERAEHVAAVGCAAGYDDAVLEVRSHRQDARVAHVEREGLILRTSSHRYRKRTVFLWYGYGYVAADARVVRRGAGSVGRAKSLSWSWKICA